MVYACDRGYVRRIDERSDFYVVRFADRRCLQTNEYEYAVAYLSLGPDGLESEIAADLYESVAYFQSEPCDAHP